MLQPCLFGIRQWSVSPIGFSTPVLLLVVHAAGCSAFESKGKDCGSGTVRLVLLALTETSPH